MSVEKREHKTEKYEEKKTPPKQPLLDHHQSTTSKVQDKIDHILKLHKNTTK